MSQLYKMDSGIQRSHVGYNTGKKGNYVIQIDLKQKSTLSKKYLYKIKTIYLKWFPFPLRFCWSAAVIVGVGSDVTDVANVVDKFTKAELLLWNDDRL